MEEQKKKLGEAIILRIENVLQKSKKTAQMFKKDDITCNSFTGIIQELKVPVTKETEVFTKTLNNVLDVINDSCVNFAKTNGSTSIPIEYIEIVVREAQKSFKEKYEQN